VNAETAMHARTRKTHEDAQLGRGLVHCVLAAVAGRGVYARGERAGCIPIADSAHCNPRTCCCRLSFVSPTAARTGLASVNYVSSTHCLMLASRRNRPLVALPPPPPRSSRRSNVPCSASPDPPPTFYSSCAAEMLCDFRLE